MGEGGDGVREGAEVKHRGTMKSSYFRDSSIFFDQQRCVVVDWELLSFIVTQAAEETVENAATAWLL